MANYGGFIPPWPGLILLYLVLFKEGMLKVVHGKDSQTITEIKNVGGKENKCRFCFQRREGSKDIGPIRSHNYRKNEQPYQCLGNGEKHPP